jgi:hypothetical protein
VDAELIGSALEIHSVVGHDPIVPREHYSD